jgi:hypothetical protein
MKATEEIEKRQRESQLAGRDRVAEIFGNMVPIPDPVLDRLRRNGALLVGEENNSLPNAKTFHYTDGSHAIVIYSGMLDFYKSATDILFSATTSYRNGRVIEPIATLEEATAHLQALFETWTPEGIAQDRISRVSQLPLPPETAENADQLRQAILRFVLSHELGHVAFYQPPKGKKPSKLTTEQEIASDAAGARQVLNSAATLGAARIPLAGAVIALRTLAIFGDLGHTFVGDHPPPLNRLETVMNVAREISVTERNYYHLAPIAYAFDNQLEDAAARVLGTLPLAVATERAFCKLSAVLEAQVNQGQDGQLVLGLMELEFQQATQSTLEAIAKIATRLFPLNPIPTPSPQRDQLWAAKGAMLRSLVDRFPERARIAFRQAFSGAGSDQV